MKSPQFREYLMRQETFSCISWLVLIVLELLLLSILIAVHISGGRSLTGGFRLLVGLTLRKIQESSQAQWQRVRKRIVQNCILWTIAIEDQFELTRFKRFVSCSSSRTLLLRVHAICLEGSAQKHALVCVSLDKRISSKHSRRKIPCLSLRRTCRGRRRKEKAAGCSLKACVETKINLIYSCGLGVESLRDYLEVERPEDSPTESTNKVIELTSQILLHHRNSRFNL